MALSPLSNVDERAVEIQPVLPSKTYKFDFTTGEVGGIIDGEDALRQFIRKVLVTERFRYLIYDRDFGCELDALIGQDYSMGHLESEIPRVITEALIYDDRIQDVTDFTISREADKLFVSFSVVTMDGAVLNEEVTL